MKMKIEKAATKDLRKYWNFRRCGGVNMLKNSIGKLIEGKNLTEQEIMDAMNCIMEGKCHQATDRQFYYCT